jgi:hypothetical protein
MTNNLATTSETGPDDDDGFRGSISSDRFVRGTLLRWNQNWTDRDGLPPPSPMLVVAINEVLQRWQNGRPEVIADKPLPDPDDLNAAIPVAEWEIGMNGQPTPPWAHTIAVYLIDPGAGGFYTFASATTGAHIAFDKLKENVISMRMLRGARVMPLVRLDQRPMKTKFGTKSRPHFEVVGWKVAGETAALPAESTPQALMAPKSPEAGQVTGPMMTLLRQAKPPVSLASETLAAMGEPKPADFDDPIPFG